LAADAAWLKTYIEKDVDKSVAFCDEQGSLLWPNSPAATGKNAIAKLTASAFAIPDFKLVIQTKSVSPIRATWAIRVALTTGVTRTHQGKLSRIKGNI
jgi:hypothetical protein